MAWIKRQIERFRKYYRSKSIQLMISITFTAAAVVCIVVMGLALYAQFTSSLRNTMILSSRQLLNQMALNLTAYTRDMLKISDSMYYSVIKDTDLARDTLDNEMNLLYEANSDNLLNISCFTAEGRVVAAVPGNTLKPGVNPAAQDWFIRAGTVIENQHFSTPHVQNLFDSSSYKYNWAISLSRMVELTRGGETSTGVLLVDMKFSGIEQIFNQMTSESNGYAYLTDKHGEIIYHPKQREIYSGLYEENNYALPNTPDGTHEESFGGAGRTVIVKSLSYTGWRLVSVIPHSEFSVGFSQTRLLVFGAAGLAIWLVVVINLLVAHWVANPIKKLDRSVKGLEAGALDGEIYIGGPHEIEHLGRTIRSLVHEMRRLMDAVVAEQEAKRKTEFEALQAQINPHFLYNTLDSIVWMVESGQQREAVSMVTALANLFRISLSKGDVVISVGTELQHAMNYMHIQNTRYKNKFLVRTEIDPAVEDCATIKLVLQPLLENAVYHAMEYKDDDGLITIRGSFEGESVVLEVRDNGLGMTAQQVDALLQPPGQSAPQPAKRHSGIGLRNVHQRVQLYYGPQYGLEIESELDVGTTVRIRLPRQPYGPLGGAATEGKA